MLPRATSDNNEASRGLDGAILCVADIRLNLSGLCEPSGQDNAAGAASLRAPSVRVLVTKLVTKLSNENRKLELKKGYEHVTL
jgi:hypothetical protein